MKRYFIPEIILLSFCIGWPANFLITLDISGVQTWQMYAFFLIFTLLPAISGIWYGYSLAKEHQCKSNS